MARTQDFRMVFDGDTGEACHQTLYTRTDSGVGIGDSILINRSYAVQATFIAPDNVQFARPMNSVDQPVLTTNVIEAWLGAPTLPGAVQLYSGPIEGLEAATTIKAILGYADLWRFVYSFWTPFLDDPVSGALLTNWHFCLPATDLTPPPPPPPAHITLDPAKYTLSWRELVDPALPANPFTRRLGDRVGVSNAELCYEDVPMLVTGLGWHWTASGQPLGETLEVTTVVSGMPRTVASGADTGFILDGGLGLGYGQLG